MDQARVFRLAPLSQMYQSITVVYSVLTVGLLIQPIMMQGRPSAFTAQPVGVILALLGAAVLLWFRPRRLEADAGGLNLVWPLRRRRIPREAILKAERLDASDLGSLTRFGVGGLGGSFGRFRSSLRGWMDGYFTTQNNLVLLTLKDARPLLLSPADVTGFLAALGLKA